MSDQNDKPVEGDKVVADVESQDAATFEDTNTAEAQETVVEDKSVTITMSKRAARIGALLLAGFLGFILGVIGTRVAHHLHDGRDGRDGRGPAHMRINDDSRMGPGQGMMPGGQGGNGMMPGGPGYGPDDQRGPGMMQDGQRGPGQGGTVPGQRGPGQGGTVPGQPGTPAPAETTN